MLLALKISSKFSTTENTEEQKTDTVYKHKNTSRTSVQLTVSQMRVFRDVARVMLESTDLSLLQHRGEMPEKLIHLHSNMANIEFQKFPLQ